MLDSPKILISPNAFKGTLAPSVAAGIIHRVLKSRLPRATSELRPLADGGDGTLDVLMVSFGGRVVATPVKGPLGSPVRARWGVVKMGRRFSHAAVIEMARASGLALVKGKKRILDATSEGTGQLLRAALDRGCRQIYIGVGGTASSDGGAGALQALGLKYFDKQGCSLSAKPRDLIRLARVDWTHFDKRLKKTRIFVLCDVKNPLLGPKGSATVFGPQKGASPKDVLFLERFLTLWARHSRFESRNKLGAGAAGALAFGLAGFAKAHLTEGAPFVMSRVGWKSCVNHSDWILTGEGRLDRSSFSGKVIGTILRYKQRARVFVLCGTTPLPDRFLKRRGISGVVRMGKEGLKNPQRSLAKATNRLLEKLVTDPARGSFFSI